MILCSWNVRGLNDPRKCREVNKFLHINNIKIVALVETKVKSQNSLKIQKKFGTSWSWVDNYSHSPRGRIWVGWCNQEFNPVVNHSTTQLIHAFVTDITGQSQFFFTAVYGLHTIGDRKSLWSNLVLLANMSCPWIVVGDFNSPLSTDDRVNGNPVTEAETIDFNDCIVAADLIHLQTIGHYFSRNNKGIGNSRIQRRIDWGFGNDCWIHSFDPTVIEYANAGVSDHTPLVITCGFQNRSGGRPFKFFNHLADHEDFERVVKDAWSSPCRGTQFQQIWNKLKEVKKGCKHLHSKEFAQLQERVDHARTFLLDIQSKIQADPQNQSLHIQEKQAVADLRK